MLPNNSLEPLGTNPFAELNGIISGDRFVGRVRPLTEIKQKITAATYPGCVSIVGQRRIGKSSLAWHSLIHQKETLHKQRFLPVWIPFDTCRAPHDFFVMLVQVAQQNLVQIGFFNPLLEKTQQSVLQSSDSWLRFNNEFNNYFIQIHDLGWKPVFVLDEFDAARQLFYDYPQAFHAIRAIADRPDSKVCFVTTSRRALYEIERQADPDSSTLSGIFHKIKLGCFSCDEVAQLLEPLQTIKLSPTPRLLDFFMESCGGQPYLSNILAFYVAQNWMESATEDLDAALQNGRGDFLEHYDKLADLLNEEDSLQKLLEVVFGPVVTATTKDAIRFQQAGLIKCSPDGYYEGFSVNFTDYLRSLHRTCDLWPLWTRTEQTLRNLVQANLGEMYGAIGWEDRVAAEHPRLRDAITEWKNVRSRERIAVGSRASEQLIDYAMSQDLWRIMKAYRKTFLPILGHDEKYWDVAFSVLFAARNRMAHGREIHVDVATRKHAMEYCNELIEAIRRRQYPVQPLEPGE